MRILRIAMAQINCVVGDLKGNTKKIKEYIRKAKTQKADIVVFPELAITGYPPEDLLLKPQFVQDNLEALEDIIQETSNISAIVGFVDKKDDIYNASAIIYDKKLYSVYHKMCLPNYSVFDEKRYFKAGEPKQVFVIYGATIGVSICEDIWYPEGPPFWEASVGEADVIININASPYHMQKWVTREKMLSTRALDNKVFVVYNNLVGGQDELVFDGHGMVHNPSGELLASGKQFEEDLLVVDLNLDEPLRAKLHETPGRIAEVEVSNPVQSLEKVVIREESFEGKRPEIKLREKKFPDPLGEVYEALKLGTRDYLHKNGFKKAVLGLSGGIDSALVATIAVDALGKENVTCVFMPSKYTSDASKKDAYKLASNLGVKLINLPIDQALKSYLDSLKLVFKDRKPDVTEENIQARIRGNLLMALSNKFGWLVLTTGNKSEMACGYATLYGDMAGGFAVIKDIPKTLVFKLAKYRSSYGRTIIPESIIKKTPSAELKPNQKDTDTLPPYEILDQILEAYVEEDKSFEEIKKLGFKPEIVKKVIKMVDNSEYKRRQAPPGIRVTPRAFGKDRRLPITNKYIEFK